MSGVLSALSGGAGAPAKCANVVFSPPMGNTPITVGISTSTPNAHIFYAGSNDGSHFPAHTGDSAAPGTTRIGSNSGSISTGAGTHIYNAVAYEPTHLDSDFTTGDYEPAG
jgi:hypothetical protein